MEDWPFEGGDDGHAPPPTKEKSLALKKYDDIVVGSGVGGLTLALLLGMNGHSVLLLEKAPRIGGSMARFKRGGVPFDVGFHFTGGFTRSKDGVLDEMLKALGIDDRIKPIFISDGSDNRLKLESEGTEFMLSGGYEETVAQTTAFFPDEKEAIEKYFEMVRDIFQRTAAIDIRTMSFSPNFIDEDFVTLDEVLNQLTDNCSLKSLLSIYSMCYGVKPSEISFANHSRISFSLYESVARVEKGGDAFVEAFRDRIEQYDIDVMCNTQIDECCDIVESCVNRFVLDTGQEVVADNCIFTIHPNEILKILPRKHLSKAFVDRVSAFESSAGFFSVFGIVEEGDSTKDFEESIVSLFPTTDVNQLLDPSYSGDPGLVIIRSREEVNGKTHYIINAFELSFAEHVQAWQDSTTGKRSPSYDEYKRQRIDSIARRVCEFYPEYKDSYKVLDAASMLTFRDYLNSPDGSAYGVKQKMRQFNLFGKLPLRNIFAAGQSSLLPGLLGAMMSGFIVGCMVMGKKEYMKLMEQTVCS
jgi:phytoene dehydrogenase-like protein